MGIPCGYQGRELVVDVWGDFEHRRSRTTLFFLHGGGQTRHSWNSSAAVLAQRGLVCVTLDGKGHGDSYWDPRDPTVGYSHAACAQDLESLVAAMDVDYSKTFLVGASFGGLTMLNCPALLNQCAGAILVDTVIQLDESGVTRIMSFMLENIDEGFASVEEAAEAVSAYQPHRKREVTPRVLESLKKNLRQREDGRWRWHWDPNFLKSSSCDDLDAAEIGNLYKKMNANDASIADSVPMTARLKMEEAARQLKVPVLLVRGKMSDVVTLDGVQHLYSLIPHLDFVDVQDASHMVAGDSNEPFLAVVADFIARHDPGTVSTVAARL